MTSYGHGHVHVLERKGSWVFNWLFAIAIIVLAWNQYGNGEWFSPLLGSVFLVVLSLIFFRVMPKKNVPWWLYLVGVLFILSSIFILLNNLGDVVNIPYIPVVSELIEGDLTWFLYILGFVALVLMLSPSKKASRGELGFAIGG